MQLQHGPCWKKSIDGGIQQREIDGAWVVMMAHTVPEGQLAWCAPAVASGLLLLEPVEVVPFHVVVVLPSPVYGSFVLVRLAS